MRKLQNAILHLAPPVLVQEVRHCPPQDHPAHNKGAAKQHATICNAKCATN